MNGPKLTRRIVVVALVALLAVAGWYRLRARNARPNVLVVTLDTLRADRLGCYGYRQGATPHLDRLAAEGVLFENAFSSVPLTLPSHVSILTGLEPPEHGVRLNSTHRLAADVPYLPELLSAHGYRSAAFIAAPVLSAPFGLSRGFDLYDDSRAEDNESALPGSHPYRPGNRVVDAAMRWIRENRNVPIFCWVHLYDPHWPYHAHADLFGDRFAAQPYDAEVAFMDKQIGRLLGCLDREGLRQRTLIIVAGDHGESLDGEHNEPRPYHGYMLYQSTMHVPLIAVWPGQIQSGRREAGLASLSDVFPTVTELLALPADYSGNGQSLVPALARGVLAPRYCYGETEYPAAFDWCPLQSITTPRWRYIRTRQPELYDWRNDPAEKTNLAQRFPEEMAGLERELAGLEALMQTREAAPALLSAAERRSLESLGYVAGSARQSSAPRSSSRPDIKQRVAALRQGHQAEDLAHAGRREEALVAWEQTSALCPESTWAIRERALLLLDMERYEDAVMGFEQLLTMIGDSDSEEGQSFPVHKVLANLAYSLSRLGRMEEAAAHAREALQGDPLLSNAHRALARVHAQAGKWDEAARAARMVCSLEETDADARVMLADILRQQGDDAGATREALEALRLNPDPPQKVRAREILKQVHR